MQRKISKWLACENVKKLLSIDSGTIPNVISEMAERVQYQRVEVYNSKDQECHKIESSVHCWIYWRTMYQRTFLPIKKKVQRLLSKSVILGKPIALAEITSNRAVYSTRGAAPTINTCGGGDRGLKF